MQFFWQDFRYGFRTVLRNPGFCAVAILALALGIGPNTAIFTMVNAVLLKPLPVPEPDRVVMIWGTLLKSGFGQLPVSAADYLEWKQQARSFDQMSAAFAIPEYGLNVSGAGDPERVPAALASKEFLPALGIKPIVGRNFLPEEDRPGGPPAVLIGNALWQRRFHSDPAAIGRTLTVDGIPRTVVGVVPHELGEMVHADLWLPTAINPNDPERQNHNYGIVARLKPGVTAAQARAEMTVIARRLERAYPATNTGWGITLFPMAQMFTGRIRPVLLILLGAVGLLLLIACANLANLLLARAATREKEIAIRGALGAGRPRIIRQLLTESLVLALAGGLLGLVLAAWGVRLMRSVVPNMFPMLQHMSVDVPVLAFTFGISILTGLLFGLVPAWRSSHTDLNTTLKEAAGRSESASGSHRIRSLLLASEVALAVLLSVSAGLLLRSFVRVTEVNPGVRTANILTMNLSLPVKYDTPLKLANFYKNLIEQLDALPGVRSAGAVVFLPLRVSILSFRIGVNSFQIEGRPPLPPVQRPMADYRMATPGYFNTMGIALRQGRLFDQHDDLDAKRVALVNEAMVRKHFAHENPLGQRIVMSGPAQMEIVGVVADAKLYGLDAPVEPAVYVPHMQHPGESMGVVVRTEGDPAAIASAVRREVLKLDPEQPVSDVRTMATVLSDSLMLRRVSMLLLAIFASLALTLATVGIYGLTAYSVSRRTHEIGLRVALGASQPQILRLVVGRGLVTSLIGACIGVAAAFALTRGLSGMLYGVTATDPMVFAGVPLLLIAVSVLASYVPARKATRIDPLTALRYE